MKALNKWIILTIYQTEKPRFR